MRAVAAVAAVAAFALPRSGFAAPRCEGQAADTARYTVCRIDLVEDRLALFLGDAAGKPFGSFAALARAVASGGRRLTLAMNAGMYHADLLPVGLFVADGEQKKAANTNDGPGNFHLKPNGVFYVKDGRAGVMETARFLESGIRPDLATQSGPMLVIDGRLHPRFIPDSTSRKIRNGIGASDDGKTVWFVLSEQPVTFHQFGRFFRDELKLDDALFLDGTISSLYDFESKRHDRLYPLGPIIGVTVSADR